MTYIDSSAILRIVLNQPGKLTGWEAVGEGITSALTRVECLRTIDCLRVLGRISDEGVSLARHAVLTQCNALATIGIGAAILDRASSPMPTHISTLDAIHLASALMWREDRGREIILATHDRALGRCAIALGLTVIGL